MTSEEPHKCEDCQYYEVLCHEGDKGCILGVIDYLEGLYDYIPTNHLYKVKLREIIDLLKQRGLKNDQ